MLKFSRTNLKKSHEAPWLILDLVMLGLLIVNLLWILFDALFATSAMRNGLDFISPAIVPAYQPIHDNFTLIDLGFVAVFFTEFCLRWIAAIYRKQYMRWYFFPFIHWYDLIGCIPASFARVFRFLRVFSILYRLHKYQIIDLRNTALFRFIAFYTDALVEELSDRIVVKVLSDAQKDIAAGSPLVQDVMQNVLASRQSILFNWLASMMNHLGDAISDKDIGQAIRQHVEQSVGKAVKDNTEVSHFTWMPIVGSTVERTLESAVTDIVTQSVVNLLTDIDAQKLADFTKRGIGDFSHEEQALEQEMVQVINECLELVKGHVSTQRWKQTLEERNAAKQTGFDLP